MVTKDNLLGKISKLIKRVDEQERKIENLQQQIYHLRGEKDPKEVNPYSTRRR